MKRPLVVAIVSGGLDSVVMAHWLSDTYRLHLLTFDYGQRHASREIRCAQLCAVGLGAQHNVIDLSSLGQLLTSNALTGTPDVPDGHYAAETMAVTVVPNRNAVMLSIAFAVAATEGADAVAIGVHAGDHFIYADCRMPFLDAFAAMEAASLAEAGAPVPILITPFVDLTKANIVHLGDVLDVPFLATYSCYKGGVAHCGTCGTCVERQEAFKLAGVSDPTVYAIPSTVPENPGKLEEQ